MNAVVAEDLVKIFEIDDQPLVAVDHLSLKIKKGTVVALLGPNGAGKTTTIRMVASIFQPSSGSVLVNDLDSLTQSLAVRAEIGIAHERPSFYERLSGRRNLQFYGELYDVQSDMLSSRIEQLASEFDLREAIDQPVGSYSKGMRQKLSVAKALVHDPPILILDEPWSGLSPGAARDLRRKIQGLGEQGKTILITTHNLSQAEQVADELIIISHGKLVASGSPEQLRDRFQLSPRLLVRLSSDESYDLEEIGKIFQVRSAHQDKDILHLEIDAFKSTPEIVRVLVKMGLDIREIREDIPSLEEIYLQLVEDEN